MHIYKNNISKYLDYVINKYGKNFIIFQDEKNLTSLVSTYESSSC